MAMQKGASSSTSVKTAQHSLLPFLQTQSQQSLTRLYQRPSSCLSIFRLLDPLSRQLILNLLWLESPVPLSVMTAWVTTEGTRAFDDAVSILTKLHILPNPSVKLSLSPTFKASMRQAIIGGGTTASFGVPADAENKKPPSPANLDAYALERWETILHYMVSSGRGQRPREPSRGVIKLLTDSGLMSGSEAAPQITSAGFQFLLQTPHEQLWQLLLRYLVMAEERGIDLIEVLSFLFMLSTMEFGWDYSTSSLSPTQEVLMEDLRDYGLVWQRKAKSKRFSPTRLATTLTSSLPSLPTSSSSSTNTAAVASGTGATSEGFIILETNYRVYAYTNNPLQTAVLHLFVNMKSRFPNLVIGMITRDSVRRALANGITADQIISYLAAYAHPQMRKFNPLIPVTVQDQIRLWELERERVKSDSGYLYQDFQSLGDYTTLVDYARQMGILLWESPAKRCFFIREDGHNVMKQFIERRKVSGGG
ncbi:transcription factor Tfb2 [Vararia minispora EC-137]|uniref:Transcription factor Tfb2 n=1 Tax=Vararia minispora EC-137 TaxID=1314806 RepID=A0ACB8QLP5_9AGAM|nr:transcription factor Tfb2 [Vararia minispora EC-137]